MVETALIAPIVVMILLLTIDLGRAYFDHLSMRNAAREGAMLGATQPTEDCTAELVDVVSQELGGASVGCGSGAFQITVADCYTFTPPSTFGACGPGPWDPTATLIYGVRLHHDFQPVVPFVGLLTGDGFGGSVDLEVVDYSPVLTNYGS